MDVYEELLRWATDQGIEIHGIEPQRIPGRGIGIVATKPIKVIQNFLLSPFSLRPSPLTFHLRQTNGCSWSPPPH